MDLEADDVVDWVELMDGIEGEGDGNDGWIQEINGDAAITDHTTPAMRKTTVITVIEDKNTE